MERKNEDATQRSGPEVIHPDELMKDITDVTLTRSMGISIVAHVLLIVLTSIPFIILCFQHGTMNPTEIEKIRKAQAAVAKTPSPAIKPSATTRPAAKRPPTRPKSRIERQLEEVSKTRPASPDVGIDDVDTLE